MGNTTLFSDLRSTFPFSHQISSLERIGEQNLMAPVAQTSRVTDYSPNLLRSIQFFALEKHVALALLVNRSYFIL